MIYNEMTCLRTLIVAIPYIGSSIDMIFYKKGHDTETFVAGEDLIEGQNCYLNTDDGKFYKASANSVKTAGTMIVKSLQKIKANKKGAFLVKGKYHTKNLKKGILYLSVEPGKLTHIMPTQSDNVIRIVSTALSENEEYFSPSSDWITHV